MASWITLGIVIGVLAVAAYATYPLWLPNMWDGR